MAQPAEYIRNEEEDSHLLPLAKPTIEHPNPLSLFQLLAILPRRHRSSIHHTLPLTQIPQGAARASLLGQCAVEDDHVLISQRANELRHLEVVGVDRDILRADDVATDVVVIADIDDGYARLLSPDH